MTGFLILLGIVLLLLGIFWLAGIRGPRLTLVAAALMLGGAGYALFGRPGLPADPRVTAESQPPLPLTGARTVFFGQFQASDRWFNMAEAFAARGKTRMAAGILGSAVRENPRNFALWTGYANALVDDAGTLTPAAQLAYERAVGLAPDHPGPRFFYALAKLRSGDAEGAREDWLALLKETPAEAPWREFIEGGLALTEGQEPTGT
ncbi:tetratricopeptide repeat protein [Sphingomicrobium clamense]|uniref:Cytochrome C biosynthesis protein n=1 Tax=Sphingomicrobium clamense TaxID=2851013 RepID=A0ABS6V6P0_9SPHN|nr:cytochrome C biosynthesis protein [Sphingomicrobium sp. B8]MBW0145236.1 cytochrome C biosynthesis protein [Sphingomicrobium sp. B8]